MTDAIAARRAAFREMHREGCFVPPNPSDGVRPVGTCGALAGAAWKAFDAAVAKLAP